MMEAFVIYSLKVTVCLAIFYAFYKLLLSRETFYRLNRLLLLCGMVVSFLLPLCVVTIEREVPVVEHGVQAEFAHSRSADSSQTSQMIRSVAVSIDEDFPWVGVAGALLVLGSVMALGWMLRAFADTRRIIRRGAFHYLDDGVFVSLHDQPVRPFSWWRWIVLSESDYSEDGEAIIAHEQAHIRCRHSFDLLIVDLLACLQWFNPAMWLLRKELCALHEYQADATVLAAGVDAKNYQLLLIKKAVGGRWYSVANSLNHSNLKNRITMMLRKKSSRWAAAKALVVLPLLCIGLGAFARTSYVASDDKATQKSLQQQGFSGGMTVKPDNAELAVWRVTLDGTGDAMMGTVGLIAMGLSGADEAEIARVEEITDILLPLTADSSAGNLGLPYPYCLVDLQPLAAGELVPDASLIDHFVICNKQKGVELYGSDGANGVVVITTKQPEQPSQAFAAESKQHDAVGRMWFHGTELSGFPGRGIGYSGSTGDGRVPSEAEYAQMIKEQEQQQSAMLTPERTFNGVVASHVENDTRIFTIHGVGDAMVAASSTCKSDPEMQRMIYRLARLAELFPDLMAEPAPLCVVDGRVVTEVPQAEYIDRMEVLTPQQGLAEYGAQGKNGVVRIISKSPEVSNLAKVEAVLATSNAGGMRCVNPNGELDPPTKVHGFYWTRPAMR